MDGAGHGLEMTVGASEAIGYKVSPLVIGYGQ
jgi:hypothetical protein